MAYDEVLAGRLRAALSGIAGVSEKKMFGGLGFMVDGHMAVAASGKGGLMLRADPEAEGALLDRDGIEPMVMRGRPMSGWLRVADEAIADDAVLAELVDGALAWVRTLPPKT